MTSLDRPLDDRGPQGDPVSWLLVERGWRIVLQDGRAAGHVTEVVGDRARDIFSGLAVRLRDGPPTRFVPAAHVVSLVEGTVVLDLEPSAVERLDALDDVFPTRSPWARIERRLRSRLP